MNQTDHDINVKKYSKSFMKDKYNEFSRQKNSTDKNLPSAGGAGAGFVDNANRHNLKPGYFSKPGNSNHTFSHTLCFQAEPNPPLICLEDYSIINDMIVQNQYPFGIIFIKCANPIC